MMRAQILTHWAQEADGSWSPAVAIDIATLAGDSCVDVTGQSGQAVPPNPNLLVVECVVSDATFAAILAHPDYGPGAVLWSDPA